MPMRVWLWFVLVVPPFPLTSTVTPLQNECYPIADVVFLIDGSDSISDEEFLDQKNFVRRFVEMSDIGADGIRVGFAVVSSRIGEALNLTSGSVKNDVLAKVDAMTHLQEGSRTDKGIVYIDDMFFRQGRLGTVYIGIILTDGRPKYPNATLAEAAVVKNSGIFLITIGVGRNIQDEMLKKMASTPGNSYHMKPMNYSLILLRETVKYLGKEWCSDLVTGLPPSSEEIKQKGQYIDFGSGSSVVNLSDSVSFLSKSAINANKNITEEKKPPSLTNIQSVIAEEKKPKVSLPQTTVYPVTRNNLGKILHALVNSKRAKSQGIAFVKSRKDLKDALRILFVSRGLGLNIINQKAGGITDTQLNKTSIVTTIPHIHVLPTIKPTIKTQTESYDAKEKLPGAKDLQIQYRDTNTGSQLGLAQPIKATQPTIFKQALLQSSSKPKHLQPKSKAFTDTATTATSHGKTSVKPTITPGAINFEDEMLIGANNNPKIVDYNVIGGTTIGPVDIKTTPHSMETEPNTQSNVMKMKPEENAISDRRQGQLSKDFSVPVPRTPPALAKLLRTRLARLGRGKYSPSVSFFKPLISQNLTQHKPAESHVLAAEKAVIKSHVKRKSKSDKTESIIAKESVGKHTDYTLQDGPKDLKSNIGFLESKADVKQFHWINMPTFDFTTIKPHEISKQTIAKPDKSQPRPSKEKQRPLQAKTLFTVSGVSDLTEQTALHKDARIFQQPVEHSNQVLSSPVSMFSDDRRLTLSIFKENTIQKGTKDFKSNKASVKGRTDVEQFQRIYQTTTGPTTTKVQETTEQIQLQHDKTKFSSESSKTKTAFNESGFFGVRDRLDPIIDPIINRRMIEKPVKHFSEVVLSPVTKKPVKHFSQVLLSPVTMFSDNRRVSFMELNPSKISVIEHPKPRVPDIQPRVPDVQHPIPDVQTSVPDMQFRDPDVHARVTGTQLSVPGVKPRVLDVQSRIPDVQPRVPDVHPRVPDVQQRVLNVQHRIPDVLSRVPDVQPHVLEVQSSVPDVQSRASDIQPRVPDVQPNIRTVQSRFSEVKPHVPDIQSRTAGFQPRVPDVQSSSPNAVPDVKPLVPDVHLRVPDIQSRVPDIPLHVPDVQPRVADVPPRVLDQTLVPDVQPHVRNVQQQTAKRRTIQGLHYGDRLTSKSTRKSKPQQASRFQSTRVNAKNVFEVDSFINIGPLTGSLGGTYSGKATSSGQAQMIPTSSFNSDYAAFESPLSYTTKPIFPPSKKAPHPSEILQDTLKVPSNFHTSDNGYHYEPRPKEAMQQSEKFSAKLNKVIQKNNGKLIIQHPEHNHTLEKATALDLCLKSRYVDGIGYTYKPNSSTDFLQCIQVNGHIKVEVGHCPMGTVFDEQFVVCRPYDRHYCPRDPCSYNKSISYGHPSNCRGYWRCESGRSIPGCCPEGFSYSSDDTCVMNPNCTIPCLEAAPGCNSSPFKTNDRFYFETFSGFGWLIRMCPTGSRYTQALCKCQSWEESETTVECSPQVSLDFEEKFGNKKALYNRNVKVEKGVGKFEGRAMITLWRFTGISFGASVLITMRFKIPEPEKYNNKLMHLLSNCCIGCRGRPGPTIDIAVLADTSGGVVVLSSYSSTSGEKFVFIPYKNTDTGWNSLIYSYDGNWLVGTVNGVTARQQMKGTIESRPYPLLLGSCGTVPSFQGYIDDFKIYLCKS